MFGRLRTRAISANRCRCVANIKLECLPANVITPALTIDIAEVILFHYIIHHLKLMNDYPNVS